MNYSVYYGVVYEKFWGEYTTLEKALEAIVYLVDSGRARPEEIGLTGPLVITITTKTHVEVSH